MFQIPWTILFGIVGVILVGVIAYLFYQKTQLDRRFAYYDSELNKLRMLSDGGGGRSSSIEQQGTCSIRNPNACDGNNAGSHGEEDRDRQQFERILEELDPNDENGDSMDLSLHDSEIEDADHDDSHNFDDCDIDDESVQADAEELSKQIRMMDRQLESDMNSSISMASAKMIRSEEHCKNILEALNTKKSELEALHATSHQDNNSELKKLVEKKVNQQFNRASLSSPVPTATVGAIDKIPYKIKYLKDLCSQHGLPCSGTKQHLMDRLLAKGISLENNLQSLTE